jgi:2,3-bisphosphoglycerate-dependent phosphoglycerate mutase
VARPRRRGGAGSAGARIQIVFETHSWTTDNDRGNATGWNPGRLSDRGRGLARRLGRRRADDGISTVFTSDLGRAVETATVAFEGANMPILHDWRLRECDYGDWNGRPAAELHAHKHKYLDTPYPGGESWREAVARASRFLGDLPLRWTGHRVLVIGHVATKWALDNHLKRHVVGRTDQLRLRMARGVGVHPASLHLSGPMRQLRRHRWRGAADVPIEGCKSAPDLPLRATALCIGHAAALRAWFGPSVRASRHSG